MMGTHSLLGFVTKLHVIIAYIYHDGGGLFMYILVKQFMCQCHKCETFVNLAYHSVSTSFSTSNNILLDQSIGLLIA